MATTTTVWTFASVFEALEKRLEAEPEGMQGEIARGRYFMSPRPRPKHGSVQVKLAAALHQRFGVFRGSDRPDWVLVMEPEIRSEGAFSRLVPDIAGWRRSTTGWPDMNVTPVTLIPDWACEILSPTTEAFDRSDKLRAYGLMGVGWVWLVDVDQGRVETYVNVRGQMQKGPAFSSQDTITGDPFGATPLPAASLFE
jgi:Uma2 family endonuclease